jgi:hypothetical protein
MRRSPLSALCTGDCASELTARIASQRSSIAARRPVRAGQGRPIGPLAHLPEHADAEAPSVPIWSGVAGSCPCTLSSCLDMRSPGHLRLSGRLHLDPGHRMVAPQTSPEHRERTPPPLLRGRMVARHTGATAVQPGKRVTDTGTQWSRLRGRSRVDEPHEP